MKSKILLILCSLVLVINFLPLNKASAAVPAISLVGQGAKALIGIGAKSGIKYGSKEAAEKAVKRWNLDLWEKYDSLSVDQKALYDNLVDRLNNTTPTPVTSKPGWGKIVVNSALFLTGADMLYDTYQYFEEKRVADQFAEIIDGMDPNNNYKNYGNLTVGNLVDVRRPNWYLTMGDFSDSTRNTYAVDGTYSYNGTVTTWFNLISHTVTTTNQVFELMLYMYDAAGRFYSRLTYYNVPIEFPVENPDKPNRTYVDPPLQDPLEMPDVISVPISTPGIPSVPEGFPEEVEILVPIDNPDFVPEEIIENNPVDDFIPEPDPGTEPDPDPGTEPDPGTDPSEPGGEEPGGEDPDGDLPSIWKPWLFLLPFLDFILAVIGFVIKLGEYILQIPLVPSKPLPGVYGDMMATLKDYHFGNVYPYSIMITLAMTLFGFTIYKILRRVFNG